MKTFTTPSNTARQVLLRPAALLVLEATLLLSNSATHAGSIFDDDYAPPKRTNPEPRHEAPPAQRPAAPAQHPAAPAERPAAPAQHEAAPAQRPPTPVIPPPRTPESVHTPGSVPPYIPPVSHLTGEARHPIPDRASRVNCRKLFEEAFAREVKDRHPDARKAFARRLYDEARKSARETADRYVLLCGALEAAEEAYNLRIAFLAAAELAESYDVDQLVTEADVVTVVFSGGPSPTIGSVYNVDATFRLADELVAQDDFADLARVEAALQHAIASISDPALKAEAMFQIRDMTALIDAHEKAKPAFEVLKKMPDDPAANAMVGSYLCFQIGQWEQGLLMLAKSNDPVLKALATAELNHAASPDAVAMAGDGWWDYATKMPRSDSRKVFSHAADLYRSVDPLLTGLRKLAIDKRLADAPVTVRPRRVDLIELFDTQTSVVNGVWRIQGGSLVGEPAADGRVEFLYEPPEEYDFQVSFTVMHEKDCAVQICQRAGHQFAFMLGSWSNTIAAFERVNGAKDNENITTKKKVRWLSSGQPYVSVIKVRKSGIEAYLNGKLVTALKTDSSELTLDRSWRLRHDDTVGFGAFDDDVHLDNAEIIEITGDGKLLPP